MIWSGVAQRVVIIIIIILKFKKKILYWKNWEKLQSVNQKKLQEGKECKADNLEVQLMAAFQFHKMEDRLTPLKDKQKPKKKTNRQPLPTIPPLTTLNDPKKFDYSFPNKLLK